MPTLTLHSRHLIPLNYYDLAKYSAQSSRFRSIEGKRPRFHEVPVIVVTVTDDEALAVRAVSKNMVEANGGSVEVEIEKGKGSILTVILPTKVAQS